MNPDCHVMLVSAQAAPNLLPAIDPALRPREAVLLASPDMREAAEHLGAALRASGVAAQIAPLDDPYDPARVAEAVFGAIDARAGKRVAVNLTGGTKLMSLGAQLGAAAADAPAFYVNHDTDEAVLVSPEIRSPQVRVPITGALRLRTYLAAYGVALSERAHPSMTLAQRDCAATLALNARTLSQPLGAINRLAAEAARQESLAATMSDGDAARHGVAAALRHFEDAGMLSVDDRRIEFPSIDARAFVNGGWLECHLYAQVDAMKNDLAIVDLGANIELRRGAGTANEIDVGFMARNRLHIVECKTRRMDAEPEVALNALYRLDSLRALGGLNTRGMLVSYRSLNDADRRRARLMGVEVIEGDALPQLRERVRAWVGGR